MDYRHNRALRIDHGRPAKQRGIGNIELVRVINLAEGIYGTAGAILTHAASREQVQGREIRSVVRQHLWQQPEVRLAAQNRRTGNVGNLVARRLRA